MARGVEKKQRSGPASSRAGGTPPRKGAPSPDIADDATDLPPRTSGPMRLRVDKWLWQARFFKSRSLAAACAESGHLRINGQPISRGSREITAGDVLTFPQGGNIRLIRILGTGVRRGPAPEAQTLYLDLDLATDAPCTPADGALLEASATSLALE